MKRAHLMIATGAGLLLVVGCPPPTASKGPGVRGSAAPRAAAPRRAAAPPPARAPKAPPLDLLHSKGVGDIHLGKPLPKRYLRAAAALEKAYIIELVGEAEAFEGVRLRRPAVVVSFGDGPFHAWLKAWWKKHNNSPPGPPKPPRARLARAAVPRIRRGAKVTVLVIRKPGIKTRGGIGVGSTLAELERAYGKSRISQIPTSWSENTCIVENNFLPARFYFKSCADARKGGRIWLILKW